MWRVQKQTPASSQHRVKVTVRHSYHNNVIEATNEGNSSGAPTESKSYHIFPPDDALQDPHNVAPRKCRERETVALYTELGSHDCATRIQPLWAFFAPSWPCNVNECLLPTSRNGIQHNRMIFHHVHVLP